MADEVINPADAQATPAPEPQSPAAERAKLQDTPAASGKSEDWFLDVDERHRYRTKDDVSKAVKEASERLASVTPVYEVAERYGVKTAEELDELFSELIEHRRAQRAPDQPKQPSDAKPEPKLSDQDEQAIRWLTEKGFVRKEDLESARREIKEARQEAQQQAAFARDAIVSEGKTYLASVLRKEGVPDDLLEDIEEVVASNLQKVSLDASGRVKPNSPLDHFLRGGELSRKAIDQAAQPSLEKLKKYRQSGVTELQQQKQKDQQSLPKSLPKSGGSKPAGEKPHQGPSLFGTPPEVHDRGWELVRESSG